MDVGVSEKEREWERECVGEREKEWGREREKESKSPTVVMGQDLNPVQRDQDFLRGGSTPDSHQEGHPSPSFWQQMVPCSLLAT